MSLEGNENNEEKEVWISYLDEDNRRREGYVRLVYQDSLIVKFKTKGNLIMLPTARILKIKQRIGRG